MQTGCEKARLIRKILDLRTAYKNSILVQEKEEEEVPTLKRDP